MTGLSRWIQILHKTAKNNIICNKHSKKLSVQMQLVNNKKAMLSLRGWCSVLSTHPYSTGNVSMITYVQIGASLPPGSEDPRLISVVIIFKLFKIMWSSYRQRDRETDRRLTKAHRASRFTRVLLKPWGKYPEVNTVGIYQFELSVKFFR